MDDVSRSVRSSAGAALMLGAALLEFFIGVEAAGKSLEDVSKPLASR